MQTAKQKVATAIREYTRLFPDEAELFAQSVAQKKDNKATKFAEVQGADAIERHLFDMPETLYTAIHRLLSEEELAWLFARDEYRKDFRGIKWFMKTYPQFSITHDF